jgi:hypothetical protein
MNILMAINFIIMGGCLVGLHHISKKTKPEIRTKWIRIGWVIVVIGLGMLVTAMLSGCALGPCGPTFYNPFNKTQKPITSTPNGTGTVTNSN